MRSPVFLLPLWVVTLAAQQPTEADARRFLDSAETRIATLYEPVSRMAWIAATYITEDTEVLSARFQTELAVTVQQLATAAARFDATPMAPDLRRRFLLLKLGLPAPPPADPALAAEMTRLQVGMEADYGRGRWCPPGGDACLDLGALSRIIAMSRHADTLRMAWEGAGGPSVRPCAIAMRALWS